MPATQAVLTRLRRFRPFWMAYNARHYRQLRANSSHYRQLGIRRSVIGSVSHRNIRRPAVDAPWLDRPDAREALAAHPDLATFPAAVQAELPRWIDDGALHLTGYLSADLVDAINAEVDALLDTGDLDFHFRDRRVMDSAKHSEAVRRAVEDGELLRLLGFLLGREVNLFRTINFIEGSEQATHSDAFHMTTEPPGYLVALWVALEDVTPDSGPLLYYPGSHRLPYVMSEDLHARGNPLFVAEGKDELYERKIAEVVESMDIAPRDFLPRKGDVLIWHANLLHGGRAIAEPGATRRSLVAHYFAKDVLCYHEVTERPAVLAAA